MDEGVAVRLAVKQAHRDPPRRFKRTAALRRPLPRRLIQQHTRRHRSVQALHWPRAGNRQPPSALAAKSSGTPFPSFPMTRATGRARFTRSAGSAPCAVVARILHAQPRAASAQNISSVRRHHRQPKHAPRRCPYSLRIPCAHGSGRHITPSAPNASADRRIVPRFPGSCSPASTSTSGADSFDRRPHVPRSNRVAQPAQQAVVVFPSSMRRPVVPWHRQHFYALATVSAPPPGAPIPALQTHRQYAAPRAPPPPEDSALRCPQVRFRFVPDSPAPAAIPSAARSACSVQCV